MAKPIWMVTSQRQTRAKHEAGAVWWGSGKSLPILLESRFECLGLYVATAERAEKEGFRQLGDRMNPIKHE